MKPKPKPQQGYVHARPQTARKQQTVMKQTVRKQIIRIMQWRPPVAARRSAHPQTTSRPVVKPPKKIPKVTPKPKPKLIHREPPSLELGVEEWIPKPRKSILKAKINLAEDHDSELDMLKAEALKFVRQGTKAKTSEDLLSSMSQTSSIEPS